ncbi:hypothetical protein HZA33_03795 [Candidatus Pacearchaeota archaeon]|nr:hypothetical protein [Candidatus Pacearchaeota archaeon]
MEEKQFCYWHVKTKENPEGTDCTAHLADARVFECPYNANEIKLSEDGRLYISHTKDRYNGACADFEPKNPDVAEGLIRQLRK